jgi:hypothetical protein
MLNEGFSLYSRLTCYKTLKDYKNALLYII